LYQDQGKLELGEPLLAQCLEIQRRLPDGDEHSVLTTMSSLGTLRSERGKQKEAAELLTEVLASQRRKFTNDSTLVAATLANLGMCYIRQDKPAEAEPLFRESLAIREKQMPNHWLRFLGVKMLGDSLLDQKRHAEAEPLLLDAYMALQPQQQAIPAGNRKNIAETAKRLVELYEKVSKPEKAAAWRAKLKM
jgi:tetratricopeptide (TPR) repeat protein